jgi:hypothetical protein
MVLGAMEKTINLTQYGGRCAVLMRSVIHVSNADTEGSPLGLLQRGSQAVGSVGAPSSSAGTPKIRWTAHATVTPIAQPPTTSSGRWAPT